MRVIRAWWVVVAASAIAGGAFVGGDLPSAGAAPAVTVPVWAASGPATRTVESSGTTSVPVMSYAMSGRKTFTDQTWDFHAKASAAGTVGLPYDWSGFHSYAGVTTHLVAYVKHRGVLSAISLVDDGPVNCCATPSGGFHYSGKVKVRVAAGDVYGFRLGGLNSDSVKTLRGRLTVGPSTATTARALADASGGGLVYDVAVSVVALPPWLGTPAGTVTVAEGTTVLGSGYLSDGAATVPVTVASPGAHTFTVTYAGDPGFAGSTTTISTAHAYDIAAGEFHSLALKSDGTVVAFGCGGGADLGQCAVPAGLGGVTAVAAGVYHSLALKSDGTVVAFGCGGGADYGQCAVPAGLGGVTAVAASVYHSLALKSDGTVVAFGCGGGFNYGQCAVPAGLHGVIAIAAGEHHSLALKSDGTVVAFGCSSDSGQCTAPAGLHAVTAVAAGTSHSLTTKSDGTVVAFGCSGASIDHGQCAVPAGLGGVTAVAAGVYQSLALQSDGTVVAFGCGGGVDYGQCAVPAGLGGVTAVAAGMFHSLALQSDGTVVAFGCTKGSDHGQCTVPPTL